MQSIRQEILPPSGVEFATSLKLVPSTVDKLQKPTLRQEFTARTLCNVVVARSNLLRIFEVREEPAPMLPEVDGGRHRRSKVRKGTEAVEGEVEMDRQGEGFVNIAKPTGSQTAAPTITKFYLVQEHCLHGVVTGIEAVKTVNSLEDKLDRLLVSFRDAKIALLEWSAAVHDLITVSIHTYERAPQLLSLDSTLFRAALRVDPLSRCAALSLPKDSFAILPFYQTLDVVDQETQQLQTRDIPYASSFLLDLPAMIDPNIRHIIDFVFLPGFNKPTVAVLFQTEQTWTGRLKEFKDTVRLIIFTLDIVGQTYPIITSVQGLPHDSLFLLPCSGTIGGVSIITSNAIIYVDQLGRKVALPLNGWASRVSDISLLPIPPDQQPRNLELEGSRAIFVDDKTMFIVLKDGTVYPVDFVTDGNKMSKINMGNALAKTTVPNVLSRVTDAHLFVGSTVGASVLLKAAHVEEEIDDEMDASPTAVVQTDDGMDLDDDDEDLYGPSKKAEPEANGIAQGEAPKRTRTVIHLSLCDALPAYGPITDMTFSLAYNGDKAVPELVAATGAGSSGGFTLFQKDLPIRTKRKLHAIGGGRGMWSLPIRQPVKSGGVAYERPVQMENDTLILSTDANPTPGLSRIAARTTRADITITTRIPGTTIGASAFFQRTAILQVMTNALRVLEPDGTERQIIKDMDGNIPRPKIRACSISDPYVLIFREDDTIGLFIGEAERGKIRRKDMSPMGDKISRYLTGCFYLDSTGLFQDNIRSTTPLNGGATSTVQSVSSKNNSQFLILVRPQGVLEVWNLPKLTLVFSTALLPELQNVLVDSQDPPAPSLPQDPPRKPQDLDAEQVLLAPLGESSPQPHLFVFLRSGQLAVYQTLPGGPGNDTPATAARSATLDIKFVKVLSKAFEIQRPEESEKSIIAEQKRVLRMFIPFTTSPAVETTFSGVFFTGDRPSWIIGTDKGGAQLYPSGHNVVHAFTSCSLWDSKGDFLVYSDEGPSLLEWIPDLALGGPLPLRSIPRGRSYSNVIFDPSTMLVVAASSLQAQFASYDEDGNRVWESDAPNVADPVCDCSTLELVSPDTWITMDGFEFATNEYVNDIAIVTLETSSTESGNKDFIAVGTSIDRGEDLAVKGAAYIFEIVEVVPDPAAPAKRWYKLRLRCRDEAKGPVTAVCGFSGYLVSSMGQKVFVRAFDSDERLVGVAFIDVGVYVTSLKTLKNLLLVGDAVKSVMFAAFQEDPYKLVLLAKDINPACITSADFFFTNGQLTISTSDENGTIRLYEFNPHDPDSRDGRHLLLRTEFQTQSECSTSITIAMRGAEDPSIPYARILTGSTDGSLATLTPVEDHSFKRLQLLQGQLLRNIQHVAGLNPKAFRIVRNEFVSKPLSKGVLDGSLLSHYESLPLPRQEEFTRQIGTDRTTVLKDWISLGGPW